MILRVSKLYGTGNYSETINANVGEALVFRLQFMQVLVFQMQKRKSNVTSPDGLKVSTTNGGDQILSVV